MKIKKFNDNEQFSYNDIMKVAELKEEVDEVIFWPNAGENYDDDDLESAWLSKEDIENLVEFLKNPNMYKDAKQYNL